MGLEHGVRVRVDNVSLARKQIDLALLGTP
jgi:hypothetical protein